MFKLKKQYKKQSTLQKTNLYFDFDGTLFDSKKGIALAVKKTAEEVYDIDYELPDEIIGPPISIIHDVIFPGYNKKEAFVKAFRNFYDNTYYTYSKPYYKNIDFFSELISINCDLNIVSNKPTKIINKLLALNNIKKYFNHFEMANYTKCHFIFANYGYGAINTEVINLDELDSLIKLLQKK